EQLARDFPDEAAHRQDAAYTLNYLGLVAGHRGQPAEAEKAHRRALDARQRLAREHPREAGYHADGLQSSSNRALLLGQRDSALGADAGLQALKAYEERVRTFPDALAFRQALAEEANGVGYRLQTAKRYADAVPLYRLAVEHWQQLIDGDPSKAYFREE